MAMQPAVVDLSHHNEVRDWKAIRSFGIQGVVHKATQGTRPQWNDRTYAARKDRAKKAGMLWGAYHFATSGDGVAQADHFLSVVGDDPDMLLCLDWEDNPLSDGRKDRMSYKEAIRFCKRIHEKTGQKPVVYGGNTLKEQIPASDTFFKDHRLWLCQYASRPVLPKQWPSYWLWQFTGDSVGPEPHDVPGIMDHGIDLNVFGGRDLEAEWATRKDCLEVADEHFVIPAADPPVPHLSLADISASDLASRTIRDANVLKIIGTATAGTAAAKGVHDANVPTAPAPPAPPVPDVSLESVGDQIGVLQRVMDGVGNLSELVVKHYWIAGIIAGIALWWYGRRIIAWYIDDIRTGKRQPVFKITKKLIG